jgi:polyphenol oxidase
MTRASVANPAGGEPQSGLEPLCDPGLSGVWHGFFGRRGGVSTGLYGSLNCGLGSQDERTAVLENRRRVAVHLGATPERLLNCHQVHSADVIVVDAPWAPDAQPRADALVTKVPGLVLGTLAADCMPILFADPDAGVVAAAHAGWKGALAGIGKTTLAAMEQLGAKASRIRAVIGPCISQSAYEVGTEFQARFEAVDPRFGRYFQALGDNGKPHFDLPGFMLDQLQGAGVGRVHWVGVCTYAGTADYFSYRRTTHRHEPDYGRQIAAISVPV